MDTITTYICPSLLQVSGLLLLGYTFLYKPGRLLITLLRNQVLACCKSSKILKPAANEYAIITGATDGIGLEYARQLAAKGFNLLLLSRTEEKLKRVSTEISAKYPQAGKIDYLAVDFSRTDIYESIKGKVDSLKGRVYLLVNNVGMLHSVPEYFAEMPEKYHQTLVNTNILSMTLMCEIALKKMLAENESEGKRPKGVIINISSSLAPQVFPLFNTYGASKAYVSYLSQSLATEYESAGILIQTVTPNQVATNMTTKIRNDVSLVSADSFVRYALRALGTESLTSAHPRHKLINWAMAIVADWASEAWLRRQMLKELVKMSTEAKKKSKRNN